MTTAIAQIDPADEQTIKGRYDYARTIATAEDLVPKALWAPVRAENGQMLPPQPSPGKIMLVMEVGRMLGMHPLAAINGVNVIEGKATISPAMMSAKVRNEGHRLRVFMEGSLEAGTLVAVAQLVRKDDPDFTFETRWSPFRAMRAKLGEYKQTPGGWVWLASKHNWLHYLEAMLKARAIGEVCREGAEDALMGAQYTPEELGADTNEEGEIPVQPAPSRDWVAAIDTAPDTEALGKLLGELTASPDYTAELFSRLIARSGMLGAQQAAAQPAAEPTPPPADDEDDVVDAEVMPDDADAPPAEHDEPEPEYTPEVTDDEPAPAAAPAAEQPDAAEEDLDPEMVRLYGVKAARAAADLSRKAATVRDQAPAKRPGFNSAAMGGDK